MLKKQHWNPEFFEDFLSNLFDLLILRNLILLNLHCKLWSRPYVLSKQFYTFLAGLCFSFFVVLEWADESNLKSFFEYQLIAALTWDSSALFSLNQKRYFLLKIPFCLKEIPIIQIIFSDLDIEGSFMLLIYLWNLIEKLTNP